MRSVGGNSRSPQYALSAAQAYIQGESPQESKAIKKQGKKSRDQKREPKKKKTRCEKKPLTQKELPKSTTTEKNKGARNGRCTMVFTRGDLCLLEGRFCVADAGGPRVKTEGARGEPGRLFSRTNHPSVA